MTIDYVVPMVFPDDKHWQRDLDRARGYREDAAGEVRYRSWGTEELLIRCIRKNLPWIRTIHIILARESQVQPWMVAMEAPLGLPLATKGTQEHTTPQVKVVLHKDIMPEDVLPTFNSRAIEMYLHKIPDLAPYFLYGNDDMFPMSPMQVEDFFRVAMRSQHTGQTALPCLRYTDKPYNASKAFHKACMNGMNFVGEQFGYKFTDRWLHIGHNIVPILKSTCEMFWERWPKKMQGSVTRFRLPQNYNQYIYSWYQILSGHYIDHQASRSYISVDASASDIASAIRNAEGLLCINDNDSVDDITNLAAVVRSEIQKKL